MERNYQARVARWLEECFGAAVSTDKAERAHRFLEEAMELAQAAGCSRHDASTLLEYVYDRPAGDLRQEAGGVLVTLAGLCEAHALHMTEAGEDELSRCQSRTAAIQAKRAGKPHNSPLPQ